MISKHINMYATYLKISFQSISFYLLVLDMNCLFTSKI